MVFTELGVDRDEVIGWASEHGEVLDAIYVPDADCEWDDELPDGWRVRFRVDPADHPDSATWSDGRVDSSHQ